MEALVTIKDAQQQVDAWISQFVEGYFPPLLNLARMTEEVGEIARVVAHMSGKKPKPGEDPGDLGMELADLLFVIICMANREGIDLEAKFTQMMEKYTVRDEQRWTKKQP
jgi:NTP pyrophosphatase (non-canonical NTP hydrolase)